MAKETAFGYVRVSGPSQIEGDGLVRQELTIKEYAQTHGITIVNIFREEGVSGTLEHRPALAELLSALESNGVTTVIIERIDRLARDLMIQEAIVADLQSRGFKLISVHDGEDLLSEDPTRKLVRQVLGAIAEYDKAMTVLKLKAARERKRAREGKCEGRKSYQETAPEVIALIRQLRRKRKGQKRMTFNQVADALNEKGYKTANGKEFNGNNVSTLMHRLK